VLVPPLLRLRKVGTAHHPVSRRVRFSGRPVQSTSGAENLPIPSSPTDDCPQPTPFSLNLSAFRIERFDEPFSRVTLSTSRGQIRARYYPAPSTKSAVVFAGGAIPGFHEPANLLYSRLALDLIKQGHSSLHIAYRFSTILEEATLDLLAGCAFLQAQGIENFAVVGHSFGGAVAIEAASQCNLITSLITLATQSCGRRSPANLAPRCALIIIHGAADHSIPPQTSQYIFESARDPKSLHIIPGASHDLTECSYMLYDLLRTSLLHRLA
jgi:pimeloyl-ACP methyl ester carboxylesterase